MRAWVPAFLDALSKVPNVSAAASAAGVSRPVVYEHRNADSEFAAAWDDALEQSTDELVGECYRRARHGCEKPVFHQGEQCGTVREYSDTLAIFLLKAHRRSVYGDKQAVEHTGANGGPIELLDAIDRIYGSVRPDSEGTGHTD